MSKLNFYPFYSIFGVSRDNDQIYKVMEPDEPQTSGHFLTTNWDLYILCQEETAEMLKSPANSARGTEGAGYKNLDNLEVFNKINSLPGSLKLSRLDEGQGIEATFRFHKANWHDSSRLKLNKTHAFFSAVPISSLQMRTTS